jgi:hypothetical protein
VDSHPRGQGIDTTTPQAEANDFVENNVFHFSALPFSWNIFILSYLRLFVNTFLKKILRRPVSHN